MLFEELKTRVQQAEKNACLIYDSSYNYCKITHYLVAEVFEHCAINVSLYSSVFKLFNISGFNIYDKSFSMLIKGRCDCEKTYENIYNYLKNKEYYIRHFLNNCYIWTTEYVLVLGDFTYYSPNKDIDPELLKCIVPENEKSTFKFVSRDINGFVTNTMSIKHVDIDLNLQYNDSLPHQNISEFINSETSGISIFHGIPGCGKSTYIRHLIESNPKISFYILDSSIFNYITDSSFIRFLIDNKNGIFILEDCESLLASREESYNNTLATLLNISDGLLGDSLNIKFICTFNSDLNSIDKALLRKGRLKVKYEFDKLDKCKAQKLIDSLNKNYTVTEPMPLCDIYNIDVDTGHKVIKQNKIGFQIWIIHYVLKIRLIILLIIYKIII